MGPSHLSCTEATVLTLTCVSKLGSASPACNVYPPGSYACDTYENARPISVAVESGLQRKVRCSLD